MQLIQKLSAVQLAKSWRGILPPNNAVCILLHALGLRTSCRPLTSKSAQPRSVKTRNTSAAARTHPICVRCSRCHNTSPRRTDYLRMEDGRRLQPDTHIESRGIRREPRNVRHNSFKTTAHKRQNIGLSRSQHRAHERRV